MDKLEAVRKVTDVLLPAAAPPALALFLRFLNVFDLAPMAHWGFPVHTAVVLLSLAGASCAYWPLRSRKARILFSLVSAFLFIGCFWYYVTLTAKPPTSGNLSWYDNSGFGSYFLTYFLFGVAGGNVCRSITQK